jgi:hypothetical protein
MSSLDFANLTEENILLYAIKSYENPICVMSEFEVDYRRVKYIKRLIRRFKLTGDLKERNILNHIIIFYNVFGVEAATRILFFKIEKRDQNVLKSFLLFLNYMPKIVYGIRGINIGSDEVIHDEKVLELLRRKVG